MKNTVVQMKNRDTGLVRGENRRLLVAARYDPQIQREKLGIVYRVDREGKKEAKRHPFSHAAAPRFVSRRRDI